MLKNEEDEKELKRIEKAGGYVSDGRVNDNLNLTRAIGDLEYKKNPNLKPEEQIISGFPDVEIRDYTDDDDFILIGCDGIWETMSTKDICEFARDQLNEKIEISKIVEDILDKVIAKETIEGFGCDNMSLILVKSVYLFVYFFNFLCDGAVQGQRVVQRIIFDLSGVYFCWS